MKFRPEDPLCRLVRFEAADGVPLSGALFEPRRPKGVAAVFVHGSGGASVFDSSRTAVLGGEMAALGVAWFAFDNRGAHLARRLKGGRRGALGGFTYELVRDGVADIDGATRALRARGYSEIHLVGHSTGANKVVLYDHYKPRNRARSYVLLAGGDDTGAFYDRLGARRFASLLARAKERRRSEELAPRDVTGLPMSWRSLYDTMNPNGDYNVFPFLEAMRGVRLSRRPLFRHLAAIRKPALLVYGDRDEYLYGDVSACVGAMVAALPPKPNLEFVVMADADHGFAGHEAALARLIAGLSSRA